MAVIEPIRRAFAVLEALNRRRSTTLSLLAAETGLPRPTLVRLLQTLIELGYASRMSREAGYRLTDRVLTLAGGVRFIDRASVWVWHTYRFHTGGGSAANPQWVARRIGSYHSRRLGSWLVACGPDTRA